MDGELTAIPSSNGEADGGEGNSHNPETPVSCRLVIDKAFPAYLALGMTYDEYFRKDHTLVIAYREAEKLKVKKRNEDMWLQGLYVYEAVARLTPLMNAFASHPKAEPYLEKPYPMRGDEGEENTEGKAVADKGLAYMQAQMFRLNKKFGLKE